jgi:hypothetical protein
MLTVSPFQTSVEEQLWRYAYIVEFPMVVCTVAKMRYR